jgi:hypothetical protein
LKVEDGGAQDEAVPEVGPGGVLLVLVPDDGETVEVGCVGFAAVLEAGLPAGVVPDGFAPGEAVGCPACMLDPATLDVGAGRRDLEEGQAGLRAGARVAWHAGQANRCSE